ncbi:MAG: hypothetical protein ACTSPB_11685 [Candidatus Thorarchaeota archaeon]
MHSLERRYKLLKERLGKGVSNITEVYFNHTQQYLIYHPIASIDFNEVMKRRKRLTEKTNLQLAGIELELDSVVEINPAKGKIRGCFHLTEWLNPDFTVGQVPESIALRKNYLEKDSRWLSGGPR